MVRMPVTFLETMGLLHNGQIEKMNNYLEKTRVTNCCNELHKMLNFKNAFLTFGYLSSMSKLSD